MDTKKDIGQFFKDNLNQMDFTPNDNGWNKIEEELQQKKKKRRAFFWLFFTAFLAGSIFTLLLGYSTNWFDLGFGNQTKSNQIESNSNANQIENNYNSNVNSNNNLNSNSNQENSNKNNTINSEAEKNSQETSLTNNQNGSNSGKNELENNTVSSSSDAHKSYRNNKNIDSKSSSFKSKISKNNSKNKSKNNFSKRKNTFNSTSYKKSLAYTQKSKSKKKNTKSDNQNYALKGLENNNTIGFDHTKINQNVSQTDSTKIIVSEEECVDTLTIASTSKKPNKKPVAKQEKDTAKVIAKDKKSAFVVSPYYGIGLFNKNQVKGNFKETQNFNITNEHYGLMIRWMTSQKYGLQIGVGYINASSKTEIEKTNSNSLIFNDVTNNSSITYPASNKLVMHHDLSMYEIPLEFYYKLLDQKIGLALSSGISHTITKNNEVYIETPDERTRIGKLESYSNQTFSANLKFYGFYKLSNKIQFEIYPSFQYQFLHSFRSNDLSPTIFSIRAGISYQF